MKAKIYLFLGFLTFSCNSYKKELHSSDIEKNLSSNIHRFIAHAGGNIEKHTYTNCLESLNLSYSKGCRLFELDIIETSDGKLAAAHDWSHYKDIISYEGPKDENPLSEKEFLSFKIYQKFTPLNMEKINQWFTDHKDAYLITDKINSPKLLAKNFLYYKERLIMELFSWEAVSEAIAQNIVPMSSENLVFGTDNIEQKLTSLNIKYIAISRTTIENNKEFLKRIKEKGIKAYVYHVNFDEGKNEQYVWDKETPFIFGMYADNLDILKTISLQ